MISVFRVIENQSTLNSYRATQDIEKAIQLELLIEYTKPKNLYHEWHELISTPFRYPLPVSSEHQARFKPPFSNRHVFYASSLIEVGLYEYSYHFMRQRLHLQKGKRKVKNESGTRTSFSVKANIANAVQLHDLPNLHEILNRHDYTESHKFIQANPEVSILIYPSVRDPKKRDNYAILDIDYLAKTIDSQLQLDFFYDYKKKSLYWGTFDLKIDWNQVD
jgi:hypothetical protein